MFARLHALERSQYSGGYWSLTLQLHLFFLQAVSHQGVLILAAFDLDATTDSQSFHPMFLLFKMRYESISNVYVDILYLWLLNFAHDNTFSDTENNV